MRRVFLSHAKEDRYKVKQLYQLLKTANFEAWFDEFDLTVGHKWKFEIQKAIQDCDLFIICLSKASIKKRGYVQAEIKYALEVALEFPEGELYIVPIRLDNCTVPFMLRDFHYANFFTEADGVKLIHILRRNVLSRADNLVDEQTATVDHYKALLKELSPRQVERKLLQELEINPSDSAFNLLLVVAILKGVSISSNAINAKLIARLERMLQYSLRDSKTRKTALFIQAFIKHDFYDRKFINTEPSTRQVLSELKLDLSQPDREILELLKFSPIFLLKIKPLLL